MQNDIQQQLEEIKTSWDEITNVPDDFAPWGYPGLTKQSIADAIGGLAEIASHLARQGDFEPQLISKATLQPVIVNLRQHVQQHVRSNPQPHIPGLLSLIEQIRLTLRSWLEDADQEGRHAVSVLTEKLAEAISRMSDAEKLYEVIRSNFDSSGVASTQAKTDSDAIATYMSNAKLLASDITTNAGTVDTLLTQVKSDAIEISELTADFTNLKTELEESKGTQKELFAQFEGYRQKVDGLLGDTNRVTMAASFITRKAELNWPLGLWVGVFILSIIGLVSISAYYLIPSLSAGKWEEAFVHLPLTAPLIWLGWFSAKQYGYTVRLREDYAYKVASAMAFEGYKREAEETDDELKKKLLDTAINNLSDNPLRVYSGHENHASPLHEILERSLKDEKLMDLFKTVLAKIKLA